MGLSMRTNLIYGNLIFFAVLVSAHYSELSNGTRKVLNNSLSMRSLALQVPDELKIVSERNIDSFFWVDCEDVQASSSRMLRTIGVQLRPTKST